MKNLAILFGSDSAEHEVSRRSASSIIENINKEKYNIYIIGITKDGAWSLYPKGDANEVLNGAWEFSSENVPCIINPDKTIGGLTVFGKDKIENIKLDCVFPVIHGTNGEDGRLQGLFELAGVPYVGSGVSASANSMDKSLTKVVVNALTDVSQAEFKIVTLDDFNKDKIAVAKACEDKIGSYPMFIKPCSQGSSVGVHKARGFGDIIKALEDAFLYDNKALVEEFIDGKEVEVAILGNKELRASTVGEIAPTKEFYDYEAKYLDDSSELYIPARISENAMEAVRENAKKVYTALGCTGLSRVDFFCTKDEEIVFNEINTLPGFTSISMYPKLFINDGISYADLIDELITLAMSGRE